MVVDLKQAVRRQELLDSSSPRYSVSRGFENYAISVNEKIHEITLNRDPNGMIFIPQQGLSTKEINTILKRDPQLTYVHKGEITETEKHDPWVDKERFIVKS